MALRSLWCFIVFGLLTFSAATAVDRKAGDEIEYIPVDAATQAQAASAFPGAKACKRLAVRKEWRDLTANNKRDYIRGIKCLQGIPSGNSSFPPQFTLFDDFVYSHARVADDVHGVGQFLPWHRHYGHMFEDALRTKCGYRGPFPFWDWARDTGNGAPIQTSPIFDPVTGFGGDGVPGTYTFPTDNDGSAMPLPESGVRGCVQTGPFANTILHYGPGLRFTDHCLLRGFAWESMYSTLNPPTIASIVSTTNYVDFWHTLEGISVILPPKLHGAAHVGVGGDMISFYTSPNEPIFHLHHAGLDRLWWNWQKTDLTNRLYQMGGRVQITEPFGEVTLNYQLPFFGFVPPVKLQKTMDVRLEPYCYTYAY